MLGPPGGGKSYESVVYHVLPALEAGRKVITNLPLNIEEIAKIEPRAPQLIELRTKTKAPEKVGGKRSPHPFGNVEDYGDDWRDPKTGQGAFYVIDECHKALPRGETLRAVDEWYAEHRHEGADVLLMSQSYGKVSKAITDQIQTVYRVKKMTAFGKSDKYIRKVQDGTKGEVMSTAERAYEKRYYKLYKSHTRTLSAVLEADARDISPSFRKWMRASYVLLAIASLILGRNVYTWATKPEPQKPSTARTEEHGGRLAEAMPSAPQPMAPPKPKEPEASKVWRLVGSWRDGAGLVYLASASGEEMMRVPEGLCQRNYGTVVCTVRGELITFRSGPPASTFLGTIAAGPIPQQPM
eukprot:TRINITY_DN11704_c0_g1_i1.p1 TRINITY_DN11704_c0_g1~~TRINITY_DN11704_c0_g1_i1.p1  ORF type:complete len:354 (+),score=29.55 TRINITY_DN11704_c0_g1_i1:339-1400(+)